MNLTELREHVAALVDLPGETIVVMSKDGEGNGFSPLAAVEEGRYLAESTWSGEHYPTLEQELADPDEWGAPEEAVPAVFLWPTN